VSRVAIGLLVVVTLVKLALAAHLALLADEAYYWVWSLRPDLGYYDQPPLVAWMIAATTAVGKSELLVRIGAVACGLAVPVALWPHAKDRVVLVAATTAPLLFGLTLFATADAPLLGAWAVGLAAALHGGRAWLLAGVAAGAAFLSKYSGAALLPLLLLAADPAERKTIWPWLGVALAAILASPNLAWNASHGWVSFRFQLHEGLVHDDPPGVLGLVRFLGDQIAAPTPILALAGVVWMTGGPGRDRARRFAWWTSAPLLLFFAAASPFAPPEAHWPAPAWIGVALGLANAERRRRLVDVGAFTAALLTAILALHAVRPVLALPEDPGARLTEGPLVAEAVAAWARPAGASLTEGPAQTVYTERYQEAAFVHFYAGIPARRLPSCGRSDQYDVWGADEEPATALFVRPARGAPPTCPAEIYPEIGPAHRLDGIDRFGRRAGVWQVFEVSR
jgi:4-amino-4-deoxy-L-arabinose transferase-like glycosyltransferase